MLTRNNILNFLKIKNIEEWHFTSDYTVNEGSKILYSNLEKCKLTFDKWLNHIYYLDLSNEKTFPIELGIFHKSIYISLGTLQGYKKYSKKYEFGVLFLFDNKDIEKIFTNKIDDKIICNTVMIQFNQELFQKALLVQN